MVNSYKNNRGQILVLVAISLVVLLGFAALAIDIGYFYHTKNQLQGAADAAALAGAAKLDGIYDLTQSGAKQEAVKYGGLNNASAGSVQLDPNDINDIAVGSWASNTFTPNVPPVNAVRVRTRKTDKDPTGFPRLFGKIFNAANQNINTEAIAARPLRASEYISFCEDICNGTFPRELETGPTVTMNGFAWTTLTTSQVTNANDIATLLCGASPFVDNCDKPIWSTMGQVTSGLRVLESLMYNPNYEVASKGTDTSTGFTTWTIIAPYIEPCPPGAQPDPQKVKGYAAVHIAAICATGEGAGSVTHIGGPSCTKAYSAPAAACSGHSNNVIVIDSVQCLACDDPSLGYKAVLVK